MNHTSEAWTEEDQQACEPDFYGKWIKCESKQPEKDGEYLVTANDIVNQWVDLVAFHSGEWAAPFIITHWMNTPECAKE